MAYLTTPTNARDIILESDLVFENRFVSNAKSVVISSNSQVFTYDGTGVLSPATQYISITATKANTPNNITWTTVPSGIALYDAISGGSSVTGTSTATNTVYLRSANFVNTAVFTGSIASGTLTISSMTSGTISIGMTIAGGSVPAGCVVIALGTGTGGVGTYIVTILSTITVGSTIGLTGTAPANSVQVIATVVDGDVISDTTSIVKLQAGFGGISAILSNETHTIPTDSTGASPVFTGSGTNIYLYEGLTQLNYDPTGGGKAVGTWTVSPSGDGNLTVGAITRVGTTIYYAQVAALTAITNSVSTAVITYLITGTSSTGIPISVTKTQTFSKSKQGTPGTPGTNGTDSTVPGPTGAQTFRIYIKTQSSAEVPSVGSTSNVGAVPSGGSSALGTTWSYSAIAPSLLTGSQAQWQCDGTALAGYYSSITWGTPYLSYFKVGSLSAIIADLGSITAGSVVIGAPVLNTVATTANPIGTKIASGTGTRLNSDGIFAAGGATSSIVGNGAAIYLNGTVVSTGNITTNAVTTSATQEVIEGTLVYPSTGVAIPTSNDRINSSYGDYPIWSLGSIYTSYNIPLHINAVITVSVYFTPTTEMRRIRVTAGLGLRSTSNSFIYLGSSTVQRLISSTEQSVLFTVPISSATQNPALSADITDTLYTLELNCIAYFLTDTYDSPVNVPNRLLTGKGTFNYLRLKR